MGPCRAPSPAERLAPLLGVAHPPRGQDGGKQGRTPTPKAGRALPRGAGAWIRGETSRQETCSLAPGSPFPPAGECGDRDPPGPPASVLVLARRKLRHGRGQGLTKVRAVQAPAPSSIGAPVQPGGLGGHSPAPMAAGRLGGTQPPPGTLRGRPCPGVTRSQVREASCSLAPPELPPAPRCHCPMSSPGVTRDSGGPARVLDVCTAPPGTADRAGSRSCPAHGGCFLHEQG